MKPLTRPAAWTVLSLAMMLSACETPTTQRYASSADNSTAIKMLGVTGVGVAPFTPPASFSDTCRALGPLKVADNLSHTQYIQRAFEDELKVGGAYATSGARVTLGGVVDRLEFSSSKGLTGGYWQIDLTITSSNGRKLAVAENYEFNTGFVANEACRNTAEAYSRAVQNIVGKALKHPSFPALLS